jgi:prepilin peptidase dependent protein B
MSMNCGRDNQGGFSLVELMVGVVVGLIIVSGVIAVYLTTTQGSSFTLRSIRLNQDMRAVMEIMVSDIRRSGYWAGAATGNPADNTFADIAISNDGGQIRYTYDTAGDTLGVRLNNGVVEMRSSGSWQVFTDPNAVEVTELQFSTKGSQCLNTVRGLPWEIVDPDDMTKPGCDPTVTGYDEDEVFSGDTLIELRQITITFAGRHAHDAALTKRLVETVKVRNNRVVVP